MHSLCATMAPLFFPLSIFGTVITLFEYLSVYSITNPRDGTVKPWRTVSFSWRSPWCLCERRPMIMCFCNCMNALFLSLFHAGIAAQIHANARDAFFKWKKTVWWQSTWHGHFGLCKIFLMQWVLMFFVLRNSQHTAWNQVTRHISPLPCLQGRIGEG